MHMSRAVITIFGSAKIVPEDIRYQAAVDLGSVLAHHGWAVCNGGYKGVMEASSKGCKEAGGHTIGVTLRQSKSACNAWVKDELPMESWQDRLFKLIDLGAAYVVCDGGTDTLVEVACIFEMVHKKMMEPKPIFLLGDVWRKVADVLDASDQIPGGKLLCQRVENVDAIIQGLKDARVSSP